jgi:chromosome segregation protein
MTATAARLTRLRIAGFKSFAEPVSVEILPGLTGIIGPNGCGKSNVVEALRWAMGESSAKSLRGGEMDDVIFAGTTTRGSRNLAEVTLSFEGAFPAPFDGEAEMQVTRRIERGAGSSYKAAGQEIRARDVQTFYADLASGARSSGMVSQGKVSALVNAKPEDRRQVLEEAAGITGLRARRHEAELKLRAADANLARAEDALGQLDSTRESLRKQAREARRYRNMSGLVTAAEADHLAIAHARAAESLAQAEESLTMAGEAVMRRAELAAEAAARVTAAEAAVPAPRQAEQEARSALERKRVEAEQLADAEARARAALHDAQNRASVIAADCDAAAARLHDAEAALAERRAEQDICRQRLEQVPAKQVLCQGEAEAARQQVREAEILLDRASHKMAAAQAELRAANTALEAATLRHHAAQQAHEIACSQHDAVFATQILPAQLHGAEMAEAQAREVLTAARVTLTAAETASRAAGIYAAEAARDADSLRQAFVKSAARLTAARQRQAQTEAELAKAEDAASAALAARVPADTMRQAQDLAEQAAQLVQTAAQAEALAAQKARDAADLAAAAKREAADLAALFARAEANFSAANQHFAAAEIEHGAAATSLRETEAKALAAKMLPEAKAASDAAVSAQAEAQQNLRKLDADFARATEVLSAAQQNAAILRARVNETRAEAEGLRRALASLAGEDGNILDVLIVPPGLEAAIGAALLGVAEASLLPGAPRHFSVFPEMPVPASIFGTKPLAALLQAPPALIRLLQFSLLLEDDSNLAAIRESLSPGQILVSRGGACWRWDGFCAEAGQAGQAGEKLLLRNKLAVLDENLAVAEDQLARAVAGLRDAEQADATTKQALLAARDRLATSERHAAEKAAQFLALHAQQEREAASILAARNLADQAVARVDTAASVLDLARAAFAACADPQLAAASAADAAAIQNQAETALRAASAQAAAARQDLARADAALKSVTETHNAAEARIAAELPARVRAQAEHDSATNGFFEVDAAHNGLADPRMAEERALAARRAATTAEAEENLCRLALTDAEATLETARTALAALTREKFAAENRLQSAAADLARAAQAVSAAAENLAEAEAIRAAVPDLAALAEAAELARDFLAEQRSNLATANQIVLTLAGEFATAETRLMALSVEIDAWQGRAAQAGSEVDTQRLRVAQAEAECVRLAPLPEKIAARHASSDAHLAEAAAHHGQILAVLQSAEAALRQAMQDERDAEYAAANAREVLARNEGIFENAAQAVAVVLARAAEKLGEDVPLPVPDDTSVSAEERARKKLDRLMRERDEMGPVNLRAEMELEEIEGRISSITVERDEVTTAIAKLRGSIGSLNREGREKLSAVFTEVDKHFRGTFTRVMGGGRAHLALVGSEDPLEAGLEIYAEPPGKKLSTLSLLSGGEQALTALSLIFSVFRCTPAPISVLDEVDAPLDDANVERFCTLLEDVVRDTGTRFLVVTHHQLTMSRMDRLYGVTMQERGVSRVLSVDLQKAAEMVEQDGAAVAAA